MKPSQTPPKFIPTASRAAGASTSDRDEQYSKQHERKPDFRALRERLVARFRNTLAHLAR
jgi:hypothetical protein